MVPNLAAVLITISYKYYTDKPPCLTMINFYNDFYELSVRRIDVNVGNRMNEILVNTNILLMYLELFFALVLYLLHDSFTYSYY